MRIGLVIIEMVVAEFMIWWVWWFGTKGRIAVGKEEEHDGPGLLYVAGTASTHRLPRPAPAMQ